MIMIAYAIIMRPAVEKFRTYYSINQRGHTNDAYRHDRLPDDWTAGLP